MELKNMNGSCELTQEEAMEVDGGAWKAIAKDIGLSILIDGTKKFVKEAWNNRANWGVQQNDPCRSTALWRIYVGR